VNCFVVKAPLALVRVTVKVSETAWALTIPLMTPVEEFKVSPSGRIPAETDQK
jgi:hypothetical protein